MTGFEFWPICIDRCWQCTLGCGDNVHRHVETIHIDMRENPLMSDENWHAITMHTDMWRQFTFSRCNHIHWRTLKFTVNTHWHVELNHIKMWWQYTFTCSANIHLHVVTIYIDMWWQYTFTCSDNIHLHVVTIYIYM